MIFPKHLLIICASALITLNTFAENIRFFSLDEVKLTDSPFHNAMEVDKKYMLELNADRLLAPYLREAGLTPKAESYGNWENTGLDGHIGGHYISALSLMYAATGDRDIKDRLDYMISELARCQDSSGDGYIGGVPGSKQLWKEIKEGNINAEGFSLNDKWVPLYNIHKPYAGLRDAYLHAGVEQARDMLIKYTDWMIDITSGLSDAQVAKMLISEHGGLNEGFADVYSLTGDKKYMELAKRFSDHRILDPLIKKEDRLTGLHANTQIPKVIGYQRIAELDNKPEWQDASIYFWDNVVNERTVSIGGNSVREHFHPVDDFSLMISDREGPETCNTYNMMRLSMMLFAQTEETKYLDYYERAVYNHILSTEHPEKGGFVYFTSMRPGHYRVYSQPHTSFWCCVGSGLENHAKYGELIYAHQNDNIYVNLFIPSILKWKEKGITLTQETSFPETEITEITVDPKKPKKFAIKVRYPEWMDGNRMTVDINGELHSFVEESGFVTINRKWRKGDKIKIYLPMQLRIEQLPDNTEFYSILYGPIVLGSRTHNRDMDGLFAGDGRMDHRAMGKYYPMNEDIKMIVCENNDFINNIKRIDGEGLRFETWDIYDPNPENTLISKTVLEPFYNIHDSRYIVYFQKTNNEDYAKSYYEREVEKRQLELESNTIDFVRPGEQQSESDHGFKSSDTDTGINHDVKWRSGTFSYNLDIKDNENPYIMIKLWGGDAGATFKITINGIYREIIEVPSHNKESFVIAEVSVPENINGKFEITFDNFVNFTNSGIYEVRLIKEEYRETENFGF